ncbi:hypothetical protein FOA52_004789 [Chlamydomonas sp. UWO 241]|nr:hypothetical protein FOA52_004789 [Chlamydomonas sp. UWO 241]
MLEFAIAVWKGEHSLSKKSRENQEATLSGLGMGSKADCVPILKRWIAEGAPCDEKELREWLRSHSDLPTVSPKMATVGFGTHVKYHEQHQAGCEKIGRLVPFKGATFPVVKMDDLTCHLSVSPPIGF